jgi:hypothetical protein
MREVIVIRSPECAKLALPQRVRLELRGEVFMVEVQRRDDCVVAILDDAAEAALDACRSVERHVSPLLFRPEAAALADLNPREKDISALMAAITARPHIELPPSPLPERRSGKRAQRWQSQPWRRK